MRVDAVAFRRFRRREIATAPRRSATIERRFDSTRSASHCRAPKHSGAVFSSKIWNSIALGRGLVCAGFAGEMVNELEAA